jgi:hypothetical protein
MVEAKSAFQGTFPYLGDAPALAFQRPDYSLVALPVLLNFISPKFHARGRPFEEVTVVTVPEATLSKQHGMKAWKREIRFAGEIGPMELKTESAPVEAAPQNDFRPSIPPADAGHHPAANSRRNNVSH